MSTLTFEKRDWLPTLPEVYFECGVGEGNSFHNAVNIQWFDMFIGCDVCRRHVDTCRKRFRDVPNTLIFFKSGVAALRMLYPALASGDRSVLFFLDSHYNGGPLDEMSGEYGQCSLLAELDVILGQEEDWIVPPILCIDDADFFTGEFWEREPVNPAFCRAHFPTIEQIRERLPGWNERLEHRSDGKLLWFWKHP